MNVDGFKIDKSDTEKILGLKFDEKLAFDDHIFDVSKKGVRKNIRVAGVTPYMGIAKKRILMKAFFTSQFSYCPLVWMCHSRTSKKMLTNSL